MVAWLHTLYMRACNHAMQLLESCYHSLPLYNVITRQLIFSSFSAASSTHHHRLPYSLAAAAVAVPPIATTLSCRGSLSRSKTAVPVPSTPPTIVFAPTPVVFSTTSDHLPVPPSSLLLRPSSSNDRPHTFTYMYTRIDEQEVTTVSARLSREEQPQTAAVQAAMRAGRELSICGARAAAA